jgi:hypothetical protein
VSAGTIQQLPAPPAADRVATKPACLTRDGRYHDHHRQIQLLLAGADRCGPVSW